MAFVDEEQKVVGEEINQAPRSLTRFSTGEMPRVVFYAVAKTDLPEHFQVVQGDATSLPLKDARFDSVFMLGGIHHVNDRLGLFREVRRILKPGGTFYWREPVSDFLLWRLLRAIIYRLSPELDYDTESPLRYDDTVPVLKDAGLKLDSWRTLGFFGACFLLNSDVLVFNRLFRFIPGIRGLTKFAAGVDEWTLQLPGLRRAGLQVIGSAHRL